MHVSEFGPPDATPVVFLHGSMVAGWMWFAQAEDLSEFRCLIPDLPGFDQSSDEEWVNFGTAADRVAEIIVERCPDRSAHVIGLSLGGIVGLHLAIRHPDAVRSLLVSGVPYGGVPLPLRALSRSFLWLYQRPWGASLVAATFGIPKDESHDAFLATARRTDPRALQAVMQEVNSGALPEDLGQLATPVLAVVGENDSALAKRAVPYLVENATTALGAIVPRVGHQWNAEDRELFSAMVRAWVTSQTVEQRLLRVR